MNLAELNLSPKQLAAIEAQQQGAILDRKGNIVWPDGKAPAPSEEELAKQERENNRREKDEQHSVMQILRGNGFTVYNLSQPRATKQTPGLADLFVFPPSGRPFWFEVKRVGGVQSEHQKEFQAHCERTGIGYLIGGRAEAWKAVREIRKVLP